MVLIVIGNTNMHPYAQYGLNIQKFALDLPFAKPSRAESQVNSLVEKFVKYSSTKDLYSMFGIIPG